MTWVTMGAICKPSSMLLAPHNRNAPPPTIQAVRSTGDQQAIASLTALDPEYPRCLLDLPNPPPQLWVKGRLPARDARGIAIVGSRAATRKACELAQQIAGDLATAGFHIVSGAALGIDGAAHRGALAARGLTYAVLGCGVDVVYPDRHVELLRGIAQSGGVLSHYPPGTPPRRGQFPVRNRLVAAMGEAVLVVEARARSGALITAWLGRSLGRQLLAVPGSAGTDALLATGQASPVRDADEVIAVLQGKQRRIVEVPAALQPLIGVLRNGPSDPGGIARSLGLALPSALSIITEAEMSGWIRRVSGGMYEVTRGN